MSISGIVRRHQIAQVMMYGVKDAICKAASASRVRSMVEKGTGIQAFGWCMVALTRTASAGRASLARVQTRPCRGGLSSSKDEWKTSFGRMSTNINSSFADDLRCRADARNRSRMR